MLLKQKLHSFVLSSNNYPTDLPVIIYSLIIVAKSASVHTLFCHDNVNCSLSYNRVMSLDMLLQILLGGELLLTLRTLGWLGVFTEVFGQTSRGEELPITLRAGEPLCVEVGLLVSLQGPGFIKHPPTMFTVVRRLHFRWSRISGLKSGLG